jgi:hypothetical protein
LVFPLEDGDTFPAGDGALEAGNRVPPDNLEIAMEDWFRRKGYLKQNEKLAVAELPSPTTWPFTQHPAQV